MWQTEIQPISTLSRLILETTKTAQQESYRTRFEKSIQRLEENSKCYAKMAMLGRVSTLSGDSLLSDLDISGKDLYRLYDSGFHNRGPGKLIYQEYLDRIIQTAPCPYCLKSFQKPNLDHFMPRSSFPEWSMEPYNLVPSCIDCNNIKLNHWNEHAFYELFNPFFIKDLGHWLHAKLEYSSNFPIVKFFVQCDPFLTDTEKHRINYQFRLFKLDKFFDGNARDQMLVTCSALSRKASEAERLDYLKERAFESMSIDRNSWEGNFYNALSNDVIFVKSGYLAYVNYEINLDLSKMFNRKLPSSSIFKNLFD